MWEAVSLKIKWVFQVDRRPNRASEICKVPEKRELSLLSWAPCVQPCSLLPSQQGCCYRRAHKGVSVSSFSSEHTRAWVWAESHFSGQHPPCYIVQHHPELQILVPSRAKIAGVHLWTKSRASCMLRQHFTNWAPGQYYFLNSIVLKSSRIAQTETRVKTFIQY